MLDLEVIGQGATTKIYRDGGTAVKLYADASYEEVCGEAERQRLAQDAGLPVPAVYGVRKLGGGAVALDMEYIDGQTLMHRRRDKDERLKAIHELAKLQLQVQNIRANGFPDLTCRLKWRIENSPYLDDDQKDLLLKRLTRLTDDSVNLCHGDFHPLNILNDGAVNWIIDWVDAAAGNPLADACRTYLIFMQYISRSAGIYLRAYCKESKAKREDVLAWLPIVAAARLSENMDNKSRVWLLDIATSIETD